MTDSLRVNSVKRALNAYLEYRLHLQPTHESVVEWIESDCIECGNVSWELRVDDFCPGITVCESDLLYWILETGFHFEGSQIRYGAFDEYSKSLEPQIDM